MPINNEPSATDSLTANEVKSYVLRTDAIAPCSVADAHAIPEAIKGEFSDFAGSAIGLIDIIGRH